MRAPARVLAPSLALAALLALCVLAPTAAAEQEFDSGDIAPGASWSFTFTEVFEDGYAYHCHPHPWMTGMVHVVADTDGVVANRTVDILEPADPQEWGYSVEHLVVEVGDTVTWNNTGAIVHTVTKAADGHDHDAMDDHDVGDHDAMGDHHETTDSEDAPGLALVGVLAGLATVLVLRRR